MCDKNFEAIFNKLCYTHDTSTVWTDFLNYCIDQFLINPDKKYFDTVMGGYKMNYINQTGVQHDEGPCDTCKYHTRYFKLHMIKSSEYCRRHYYYLHQSNKPRTCRYYKQKRLPNIHYIIEI